MADPPNFSSGPPQSDPKYPWSMGHPLNFSSGPPQSVPTPQTHRPVSPVPSCVSMKSDWSMEHPLNFSNGPPQSDPKPQTHRPVYPVPSCVSLKSDWSMADPPNFSSGPPQSDPKYPWSMGHPLNFSSGPPQSVPTPQTHRPVSPVPSCVSMKSDWSMEHPLNFSNGPPQSDPKPQTRRPVSPVPSCVSMKSDGSMVDPPNFSNGPPQSHPNVWRNVLTQDQSRCGVCEQLLRDPVITTCGHSFCRQCISSYWSQPGPSGDYSCPQCRKRSRAQPFLIPDITMAQPLLYPHTTMTQPPVYPPTAMAQSSLYQHREMAQLHLKQSSTMTQVPPYPHPDSGQDPLYPHFHMAQISPQPPLDEHKVMEGSKHLQTEHAPVKRAKLPDDVLDRALVNHKASMKRRFESISEGVIRSETQTLLNKIYTELYITEGESEGVNNEHEVWQVESASRSQTTEDTAIHCNDIFKPLPGQQRQIRTVMTKGIAGIGKTVSVQKFLLDWAEEKANQDVDFMFILPFRELNLVKHDQYSLQRLLLDFHPELRELQDGEYKDRHIVFIFDGLDESRLPLNFQDNQKLSDVTQTSSVDVLMTSLIQGTLLPSALIWITSRPAAANQIPSQSINQVTEVRGFSDPQKEEYFRKRISDQNQANRIILHIKASRSLHIMCHMPVFCWISATVLQQILEEDDGKEAPKTLTEMFIHFLLIQTTRKNQKYQEENNIYRQRLLESHKDVILKLAQLAFKHLENGKLMFYEEDLKECGIDVNEASVYSGMCTEIFREECVFQHKKVYCFVHLSIQEFLAALHVFASYLSKNMVALTPFLKGKSRSFPDVPLHELLKNAVNKALESKNGHLDLFVRFLHGISLESNQRLLVGLLTHTHSSPESEKKTIRNLKVMQRPNISPERCINLFHCLVEMHDSSVHDEIKAFLQAEKGSVKQLSLAHCSALAHVLLMSGEVLDEFDLKKYKTSPEGRRRLVPAVKCCRKAILADCKLTERSYEIVASALQSANSPLRELDLSHSDLQQSGAMLGSALQSPNCKLETLRLAGCKLTGRFLALTLQGTNPHLRELDISDGELQDCKGELLHQPLNEDCKVRLICCRLKDSSCAVVASVLQFCVSQLSDLDMSGCDLQTSEEKLLSNLGNPNCRLKTLKLAGCKLTGRCLALTIQGANPHLREMDISDSELQDSGGELLHQPLNQDCKVRLICCRLKDSSCAVVASVLQFCVSQLSDLDMSGCDLQTSEEKLLSNLGNPNCRLKTLKLKGCKLTHESCKVVASFLQSANPLLELDMSNNVLRDSGVHLLSKGLSSPHCKLQILRLSDSHISDDGYVCLAFTLMANPSCVKELDVSNNNPGESAKNLLFATLKDPHFKIEELRLADCKLTEESYKAVASVLQSLVSLRELDLTNNYLKDSGVQLLSAGLSSPHCKLQTLRLADCKLTEESCKALASTLQSSVSLTELDLTNNDLKDSGIQLLSAGLSNPHCTLQTLRLADCKLTEESCKAVASALQSSVSLTELDLTNNDLKNSGIQLLSAGLSSPHCKLQTLRLSHCLISHEGCSFLASALKLNPSYLKQLDLSYNHPGDSGVRELTGRLNDPNCNLKTFRYDHGGEFRIKPGPRKCECLSSGGEEVALPTVVSPPIRTDPTTREVYHCSKSWKGEKQAEAEAKSQRKQRNPSGLGNFSFSATGTRRICGLRDPGARHCVK
ncbi:NACHT, LRR and PYD domains-containing protein 12-like [Clupea harengus]|uniref:NACHT, LRR and PYD domains-containing protein 12-like n=1 Tax=Clupea harengus TaxID=7950 RepID=A0A8M1KAG1_CLUHA|nr:NACHT, LRR and PYD domains-containing protein 12-like [Clupea harengus]